MVWYRASSECPQGAEFLGKLAERANLARLAGAGDHIDFVVTLQSFDGETVGRLERQTQGGTVAIRELRDASCPRVADALALSLGLSLEPAKKPTESRAGSETNPAATASPSAAAALPAAAAPLAETATVPRTQLGQPKVAWSVERNASRVNAPPRGDEFRGGWLGLQGGALVGVAPRPLPRAALFLGIEDPWPTWLRGASLRFAAIGALGSAPTSVGPVQRWLLAGRVEGCPLHFGGPALSVAPCLALELGATSAAQEASTTRDTGLWAAGAASLRAALRLTRGLALEAQAEAQLPLYRNDVYADQRAVYRAETVAFQGGLGVSMHLW